MSSSFLAAVSQRALDVAGQHPSPNVWHSFVLAHIDKWIAADDTLSRRSLCSMLRECPEPTDAIDLLASTRDILTPDNANVLVMYIAAALNQEVDHLLLLGVGAKADDSTAGCAIADPSHSIGARARGIRTIVQRLSHLPPSSRGALISSLLPATELICLCLHPELVDPRESDDGTCALAEGTGMDSFFSARWRSAAQAWLDARWQAQQEFEAVELLGLYSDHEEHPQILRDACPLDSPGETLTPAQRQTWDEALPRAILSLFRAIGGHVLGAAPTQAEEDEGDGAVDVTDVTDSDTATRRRDSRPTIVDVTDGAPPSNEWRASIHSPPPPLALADLWNWQPPPSKALDDSHPSDPDFDSPPTEPTADDEPTADPATDAASPTPPPPASRTLLSLLLACPAAASLGGLDISGARACAPSLALLPATCTSLRELWLRGLLLSQSSLLPLASLPELKLLALGGCGGIDDTALRAYLSALARQICHEITQQPSSSVFSGVRLHSAQQNLFSSPMKRTRLSGSLPPQDLGQVTAPALTHLELRGLAALTDDAVDAISQYLGGLCELSLYGCRRLTDKGLIHLSGTECPNLRYLNMTGAYKLTDNGRRCLLSSHPSLLLYTKPYLFGTPEHGFSSLRPGVTGPR